ncbi:hypothetical protein K1I53_07275 [Streptococcus oralis]|uniref:hypothetical protein n=1 Tax=Streptococcus oralis TaxID=1303 RepID=UPI001CBD0955|nr:hypothetical protein [Streptococcus oralis]MBZ2087542.1 hypothetical protein [Streptococcus oralis]
MAEEIAVYKFQEWNMGDGEKKYSQLGNLEAHYHFAKNNGGKVLFTTKSKLYQRNVGYVLLTLPNGEYGFLSKIIEKGTYPQIPEDSSYTIPTEWSNLNETIEKQSNFNWIALEVVSNIIENIENIPEMPSPQYMKKEESQKYLNSIDY